MDKTFEPKLALFIFQNKINSLSYPSISFKDEVEGILVELFNNLIEYKVKDPFNSVYNLIFKNKNNIVKSSYKFRINTILICLNELKKDIEKLADPIGNLSVLNKLKAKGLDERFIILYTKSIS